MALWIIAHGRSRDVPSPERLELHGPAARQFSNSGSGTPRSLRWSVILSTARLPAAREASIQTDRTSGADGASETITHRAQAEAKAMPRNDRMAMIIEAVLMGFNAAAGKKTAKAGKH